MNLHVVVVWIGFDQSESGMDMALLSRIPIRLSISSPVGVSDNVRRLVYNILVKVFLFYFFTFCVISS